MVSPKVELINLINLFISGKDRTLAHVNRMEGLLIEHFMDTDLYEELGPYLAMYSPIHGEPEDLYNEEQLVRELRYVLQHYLGGEDAGR